MIRRPTTPQRSATRAKVILAAADGVSNAKIARRVGIARQNVLEIRQRFTERGIKSVLEDARRPGRPKLIGPKTVEKIVDTTMTERQRTHHILARWPANSAWGAALFSVFCTLTISSRTARDV